MSRYKGAFESKREQGGGPVGYVCEGAVSGRTQCGWGAPRVGAFQARAAGRSTLRVDGPDLAGRDPKRQRIAAFLAGDRGRRGTSGARGRATLGPRSLR